MNRFPSWLLAFSYLACVFVGNGRLYGKEEARLLRFPAVHGKQVAFSYAGDLYSVPATGGVARKLTTDQGYEMFPRFSPDGQWIAFTGQYDGNTEVYLMPAEGGIPRRLTYTATLGRDDVSDRMGPNNIVMTWRDQDHIVFRSRGREWNDFNGQLFTVSVQGGMPEQLPLPRGGWCSYSPDKKQLAYNRVFREFRTWKRYRGGQADEIWIYDFASQGLQNVTQNPAQDIFPMWHGQKVYFLSDRDENRRMNLYAHDLKRKTTQALTEFKDFDIKFPSLGDQGIVFENGGYLYLYSFASRRARKVPVYIQEDFSVGRGGWREVSQDIHHFDLSPEGSRALFGARGDLFTVPAKHGNIRNLTPTPGVHERNGAWSPDGRWIAYVSDATGEDELHLVSPDGQSPATQLTAQGDTYKYHLLWSPDAKKILWSDKKQRLQYIEVDTKKVVLVVQATAWEIRSFCWSPDSLWIAYTKPEERQMSRIYLYSVATQQTVPVTDSWFESKDPAFSADGKLLFFVSDRSFSPKFSQSEWNHAYFDMESIYFVTLAKDTPSPLAPKSDEVQIKKDLQPDGAKANPAATGEDTANPADGGKNKKDKKETDKPAPLKVEAEGLMQRIAALPIVSSQYSSLTAVGDKLYYLRHGVKDEKTRWLMYDLDKQKETELGEVDGYTLSADHKKALIKQDHAYALLDLPTARLEVKEKLKLSEMKVLLDRQAEWKQIYHECWRQMRDFVYAPNLHGVDWPALRRRYEPLLAHVQHRADLTYVVGEMIAELNLGHCYVGGGDYPKAERIPLGLLGAQIVRDPASGYFRLQKILKGQNWDKSLRSPLTEIGVNAHEGDYILALNGQPANRWPDLYAALVDTAGKQVTLKLNREPREEGAWTTVVVPVADERPLYYYNWVQKNLDRVDQSTGGRVGYVHVPNMGVDGLNEFVKYYYPQTHKQGLIVDVRGNGGGNVSPQIIERLRREMAMITVARNSSVNVDPSGMVLGPKVMLLDEFSASDGDIVAYRFKKYKLGPVVGKRSWGGVVGIRGSLPLLDGGYLNRPEFSRYDVEGKEWIMEGVGVEPDIPVDNDPAREMAGVDDQLEKALEVIKDELAQHPVKLPGPPPYPDKNK